LLPAWRERPTSTIDRTTYFERSITTVVARRYALLSLFFGLLPACGGPNSRLVTVRTSNGSGAVDLSVKNSSDRPINALYIAKTERVNAAGQDLDYGSPQGVAIWGPDLLTHSGIGVGQRIQVDVPPGTWDVRALDRGRRYQHITGLRLGAGGRYILELNDGGWRSK
jgi:hypothetical protein